MSSSPSSSTGGCAASTAPSDNAPAAFVATQVVSSSGQIVGVLILQIPVDGINAIMNDARGIGDTTQIYVLGQDLIVRSDSRFEGGYQAMDLMEETPQIASAVAGESSFFQSGSPD